MQKYGFYTPKRHPNFIISDLIASAQYFNIPLEFENPDFQIGKNPERNFITCFLPSDEDARKIAQRSTVVEHVSRLMAEAETLDELLEMASNVNHDINKGTFSFRVITHGRKITNEMRRDYITKAAKSLKITSKANLKNPDTTILLILDFEECGELNPIRLYLSLFISDGNSKFPDKFTLKTRKFINKTSMESAVALYSASQGLCGPGTFAFDPFCGSGSLLVACASLGSYVLGADFDMPSMSQSSTSSVYANFQQYGLTERFLGIAKCDFLSGVYGFEGRPVLDAIVTDPPYGIREKCIADGTSPLLPLLLKLYEFAAKALKVGGRLVFWLPCAYNLDTEKDLPKHPALKLISNCQQSLMSRYCRHLLTYQKIAEIDAKVEFNAYNASFLHVRDLVFQKAEGNRGNNRKEKRKFARELKKKLSERKD
ncbi:tRNA (guanine(10)-N2)-methyltransferase [Histomonas meleagridis]|uniref:tRNA (guanine(10)-N2)-methyltransferase-like n=1 Tax=Histomonas meleagridis TaxID=135588 RepID=UPI003559E9BC|nr:tRNA (guanine(10)-N2)-methyltransferase [Histomonas meleagridis]KAH0804067.1 tRNA (guanine(10)-N2)-methyltransferase-like [Histomonas meleagridis]